MNGRGGNSSVLIVAMVLLAFFVCPATLTAVSGETGGTAGLLAFFHTVEVSIITIVNNLTLFGILTAGVVLFYLFVRYVVPHINHTETTTYVIGDRSAGSWGGGSVSNTHTEQAPRGGKRQRARQDHTDEW